MYKNSENEKWRDATEEEFKELMEGLKANQAAIQDSYEELFEDLLEYLEKRGPAACKTMRAEHSGPILHFMLHFCSPAWTWQNCVAWMVIYS